MLNQCLRHLLWRKTFQDLVIEKLLAGYNPVEFLKINLVKELGDEDHMSNNNFLNIIALNFR